MALEKFIVGKHDDCKHEGRASERRRIQAAEWELKDYLTMIPGEVYIIDASDSIRQDYGKSPNNSETE